MLRQRTGHDSVKRLPLDKRRDGSFEGFSFSPSAILLVPFVIDLKAAIEATPQEIRRSFLCTRTCREIRLKRCCEVFSAISVFIGESDHGILDLKRFVAAVFRCPHLGWNY
ncbi:hypothetical protein GW17_00036708 [Ensete ventricosum]|nr:hypothetical protein GW17_00036708 [Ensete ventricosum]RZS10202.1 hypothetical protein BHM03_00041385 [Ensete ventricosum]